MIPCRCPPIHRLPRKHDLILATALCLFAVPGLLTAAPLYGPQRYDRTTGPPNTYSASFEACNTQTSYELLVQNGEGDKNKVSSASVTLNGVEVVKESEFNQKVAEIRKPVTLAAENSLGVKLQSGPGGGITVTVSCTQGCLDVHIASPDGGARVDGRDAIVRGTLSNASGETGLSLRAERASGEARALALVRGGDFAGMIPLELGTTVISATATDVCGLAATDSITITTGSTEEPVDLALARPSGLAPLDVFLQTTVNLPSPPSQFQWDFDGDGVVDEAGPDLSSIHHVYDVPGIYFPRVTVSQFEPAALGGQGFAPAEVAVPAADTGIVVVWSREDVLGFLERRWQKMKDGLTGKEVELAVEQFMDGSKDQFRWIFTALREKLPSIASQMGAIELVYVKDGVAKARIRRTEPEGEMTYYIYFGRDPQGLWRIQAF